MEVILYLSHPIFGIKWINVYFGIIFHLGEATRILARIFAERFLGSSAGPEVVSSGLEAWLLLLDQLWAWDTQGHLLWGRWPVGIEWWLGSGVWTFATLFSYDRGWFINPIWKGVRYPPIMIRIFFRIPLLKVWWPSPKVIMKVLVEIPYYKCDHPGGHDCILGGWNQRIFFGMSFVDKITFPVLWWFLNVYSSWKVDGTVPTYWFIRTLY